MQYFIKRGDKINGSSNAAQVKLGGRTGKFKDSDMIFKLKYGLWKSIERAFGHRVESKTPSSQDCNKELVPLEKMFGLNPLYKIESKLRDLNWTTLPIEFDGCGSTSVSKMCCQLFIRWELCVS